jgi:HAD superfamily hydrolase (TIGR01509 family)
MCPKSAEPGDRTFPATLFDYNGVLVDDEAVHFAAFRDALGPLGVTVSEDAYWERYLGYDDVGAFHAMLADAGRSASKDEVRELVEAKRPLYLERARDALQCFAGARELVLRRAARGPVGVVSGALRSEIDLGLGLLGVEEHVRVVVAAEDTSLSKPSPEGYLLGIERLARLTNETIARGALVIEDSLAGVEAAKAAGLACVGVAHSYRAARLAEAGADDVVESLDAIDEARLAALYVRTRG